MRNIKRILIIALLAVFVALPVLSQTAKVSAANDPGAGGPGGGGSSFEQASTTTKAAIWALGRAVAKCLNDGNNRASGRFGGAPPTISDSDASQGQWESSLKTDESVGEFTRLVVNGDGSGGTNGDQAACTDVIQKELQLTGLDPATVLCGMGYTRNGTDCLNGAGDWSLPTKAPSSSDCTNPQPSLGGCGLKNLWDSFFKTSYILNSSSISGAATTAMRYYIYFNEFQQECGDGAGGGLTVSDWNGQSLDSHSYHLPWYTDGAVQDAYVVSSNYDSSHTVRIDGWQLIDNSGENNDVMSCNALAKDIAADGSAFKAALKADQRAGRDQLDTGSTANDGNSDPTCESSSGELGWILCGIIDSLQNAVGGIYDHVIKPLLITPPLTTKDARGSGIFRAWSNFRIYGDVFLVIALLVIVFGESLGGGMIDAYTAKKVLPRLLAAAILINLSYYIAAVLVDITNILGDGMMTLITSPFGLTNGQFAIQIDKSGATTMSALLGGAVVWGALSASGPFIGVLWTCVLVPMLLIFLAIMVVVLLRAALIVFLVIVAPVAFALYCLPNTEKYFRQWWDALFKTLLVYPIIAVLFALGKVAGYLINLTSNANFVTSGIGTVMAVVALVIPLLLVPFAFRLAGGVIGRAHDLVSGGRQRLHAMGEGKRADARARLGRVQQQRKAWASNAAINRNPLGKAAQRIPIAGKHIGAYASRQEQKLSIAQMEMLKNNPHAATVANDELALKAAMYGRHGYGAGVQGLTDELIASGKSKEEAGRMARDAAQRWQATGMGFNQSAGLAAFQMGVQDGTVFKDNEQQTKFINQLTGQDESLRARTWGAAYAGNKQAGRYDLSPSYGTGKALADAMARGGSFKEGETFMGVKRTAADGNLEVTSEDFRMAAVEGVRSTSNTELSRIKGMGLENFTTSANLALEAPSVSDRAKAEIVTKLENMRDSGMYMPEVHLDKLTSTTDDRPDKLSIGGNAAAVQQVTAEVRNAASVPTQLNVRAQEASARAAALESQYNQAVDLAFEHSGNIGYAEAANRLRDLADQATAEAVTAQQAAQNAGTDEVAEVYRNQRTTGRYDPRGPGGPMDPGAAPPPAPPEFGGGS